MDRVAFYLATFKGTLRLVLPLVVVLMAFIMCSQCQTCSDEPTSFNEFLCTDQQMELVVMSNPFLITSATSIAECVYSCSTHLDPECKYGIFHKDVPECYLVNGADGFSATSKNYSDPCLSACVVVKKEKTGSDIIQCQNGGLPRGYTCACSPRHAGRYCEINNPEGCVLNEWLPTTTASLIDLSFVPVPVKMRVGSFIIPVRFIEFYPNHSTTVVQALNFFSMGEDGSLETTPVAMEFVLYGTSDEIALKSKVNLFTGELIPGDRSETNDVDFLHRSGFDSSFNPGTTLIESFLQGHRRIDRGYSRTRFDKKLSQAYYENVRGSLLVNVSSHTLDWQTPPIYHSFKESSEDATKFVLEHSVGGAEDIGVEVLGVTEGMGVTGGMVVTEGMVDTGSEGDSVFFSRSYDITTNTVLGSSWAVDTCWTQVYQTSDYDEFTSILKEFALNGHDLRVVLDSGDSSDTSTIIITNQEVVVELAEYLTPFNFDGRLDTQSILRQTVVSRSKRMIECYNSLDGQHTNLHSRQSIDDLKWYVSTRPTKKLLSLSLSGSGGVILGDKQAVLTAAANGKNIRVCVVIHNGKTTHCFGNSAMMKTSDGDVVFQSPVFFRLTYHHADKFLDNILDHDCKRTVYTVSTGGWVKRHTFKFGNPTVLDTPQGIGIYRLDWFV